MAGIPASLRFGAAQTAKPGGAARPPSAGGSSGSKHKATVTQQQQPSANAAWRAECARAAAQLVISVPTDTGASTAAPASWRPQLDHALAALGSLQAAALGVRAAVEGSASQLAARAERLAMAKEAADAQLAGLQAAHRAALAAVATLREEAEGRREYVAQLEQELAFLNKELEERQREVAEQGDSMSDTRPVARLAVACAKLRGELAQMEVRRGVLQAALLSMAARAP